ncbi:hypothetical protein O77CONTIG1_01321 [Leptolyngbya sp. O-77]|nr:hypothetical protein O77CONTIG1_01321 [Leptolyngbya sp. O-77]
MSQPIITSCNKIDGLSAQMASPSFCLHRVYTTEPEQDRTLRLLAAAKNLKKQLITFRNINACYREAKKFQLLAY